MGGTPKPSLELRPSCPLGRRYALASGHRERRVSTRRINGIDQDVRLNRALWQLAGKMAELKGAGPEIIDAEVIETCITHFPGGLRTLPQ
jgi:hypothetical protein